MIQRAIQEAATAILAAYLSRHEIETAHLPSLIATVGLALSPVPDVETPLAPVSQLGRRKGKAKTSTAADLEFRRIEHVDQIEMLWQDEVVVAKSGEGEAAHIQGHWVPEPDAAPVPPVKTEPDATPWEAGDTDQPEVATEAGVTITRFPEARRGRKRLG
ncbi:hypothetical protein ACELLULO517_26860 [Acidisoma cellulosilytica]|uniref:Uncharacterized protein n=1 Tax=Acidisoma cellulosilyticum TaxID=2802395 RepID=A0A963Z7A1_9PROT|nr:hypothetical protein [Acidisoma cellulosilyticum]MCB8883896.1 hypothetical protein [Acidisoma cellulosilyticum]